jgi:DNA replication and repair protein RecF
MGKIKDFISIFFNNLHPLKSHCKTTNSIPVSLKDVFKRFHYSITRIFRANFEFDGKIICFVGKNGIGKTDVLDAIYHLSYGKSYFNAE